MPECVRPARGTNIPTAVYWLPTSDETPLYTRRQPSATAVGAVMPSYGMVKHAGHYKRLTAALDAASYHSYTIGQRNHGRTTEADELGHFADQGSWGRAVSDLVNLNHRIRRQHPELPVFLLGHSMGSYISMAYLLHHSCSL